MSNFIIATMILSYVVAFIVIPYKFYVRSPGVAWFLFALTIAGNGSLAWILIASNGGAP